MAKTPPRFPSPDIWPFSRRHSGSRTTHEGGKPRRSLRPALEPCEGRTLMTIAWKWNVIDSPPMMSSMQNPAPHAIKSADLMRNLNDAGAILSNLLGQWNETITVNVSFAATVGNDSGRGGGQPIGKYTDVGAFTRNGTTYTVQEPPTITAARTGGAAGINLTLAPDYLTSSVWIDESPKLNDPNPIKDDFVSLTVHELIHGLGFVGNRIHDMKTPNLLGTFPAGNTITSFDALTDPLPGPSGAPITFNGALAEADNNGQPVPLMSIVPKDAKEQVFFYQEAFYHVGNFGVTSYNTDAMFGQYLPAGRYTRANLTLDVAMLNDLFYFPEDRTNIVVVLDGSASNAGGLAQDVSDDQAYVTRLLKQDPLSSVTIIVWTSSTASTQSKFTTDLSLVRSEFAGIKASKSKGPIPSTAYKQLYAQILKGNANGQALTWPKSATELVFDDNPPFKIPAP